MTKLFILMITAVTVIAAEKARFDNYRVYSIEIENEDQLQVLQQIENHQDGLLFTIPPIVVPMRVEVVVPPHKFADIFELCEKYSIENEIKIENLQKYIKKSVSNCFIIQKNKKKIHFFRVTKID